MVYSPLLDSLATIEGFGLSYFASHAVSVYLSEGTAAFQPLCFMGKETLVNSVIILRTLVKDKDKSSAVTW